MKKSYMLFLLAFLSGGLYSQNEDDALRYSQTNFGGTARYNSLAGAFGALGGDISSLSTNPAGLGIYRSTEFTFTPSISNSISNSTHYGNSTEDSKLNFNFNNLGFVGVFDGGGNSGWESSAIGIGYNRLADFHSRSTIKGSNPHSSLLDVYLGQIAAGDGDLPFSTNLAWQTYLVDTLYGNYIHALQDNYGNAMYGETQSNTITTRGSLGETVFSLGGNYNNKLYVGGTFGITSVRFTKESNYMETPAETDTMAVVEYFVLNENLHTSGRGMNFKFGMIYRFNDFVRVGGALHSPSWYSLTDSWTSNIVANYNDTTKYEAESPKGLFDYSLTTPFRAIGSAAFIIGKSGLITADAEFVDYSMARLDADNYGFGPENQNIKNKYTSTGNFRLGTEWRVQPFSFRGGFAYYGNPYSSAVGNNGSRTSYTFGFGIREQGYFLDFGYVLTKSAAQQLHLYDPELIAPSEIKTKAHAFMVTLGLRY